MKIRLKILLPILGLGLATTSLLAAQPYTIVDTGQTKCYDNTKEIPCPQPGQPFYGQDAQYQDKQPAYRDNRDGTVTDLNTGLMWQKTPDLDHLPTYHEAVTGAKTFRLAGHTDWRLPTIKELYSLIDFNGNSRARRPAPIHQLIVQNRVSIVFHGHDHLYAKQDLDGIVYQEVPQLGDPKGSTRSAGNTATRAVSSSAVPATCGSR